MSESVPAAQRLEATAVLLGEGMPIARLLPVRQRRLVGAWCFLDHFGPTDLNGGRGMRVGPHPHIGLQTVTWLLAGEVLHRDSLGSLQVIRPGQLNLMTAGRGISHSEESPQPVAPRLHGAQLWIALPESARHLAPDFAHHEHLPAADCDGWRITVLIGEALGARSPARVYMPLVGLDAATDAPGQCRLPLQPAFEYAFAVLSGEARVNGELLQPHAWIYLPPGQSSVLLESDGPLRLLVLGGEPFPEPVLMWWNFVGREKAELVKACRDWNAGADYFGAVTGYDGERLSAPMPPWREESA